MSLDKIINNAKVPKEEMSAISFNIPARLKKELVGLAKENDITVQAFLNSMIDDTLNGKENNSKNLEIVEKIQSLQRKKEELEIAFHKTNEDFLELTNGVVLDMKNEISTINYMINLLQKGL